MIHYKVDFKAFDLETRQMISCFGYPDVKFPNGTIDDLLNWMRNELCNKFGFKLNLRTQILGDQNNPIQVRIVGYEPGDDLAIIEATHIDAKVT